MKATANKKTEILLSWSPAKVIPLQSMHIPEEKKINDNKPEPVVKEKKDKNIKFCEPVFKPKKHDFL